MKAILRTNNIEKLVFEMSKCKVKGFLIPFFFLVLGNSVTAQTTTRFNDGYLTVFRVTSGAALTNAGTAVVIEEYTPITSNQTSANFSVTMPTSTGNKIVVSGTGTAAGELSRSENGRYIVVPGYNGLVGDVNTTFTTNGTLRTVDAIGNVGAGVTASSALWTSASNNIRGGTSDDGTNFWVTGNGAGIQNVTSPNSPVIVSSTSTNNRGAFIFNGQLYLTSGAGSQGVYAVGTGKPLGTGNTAVRLFAPTNTDTYGFSISPDGLTIYYVGASTGGGTAGIYRSTFNGSVWTAGTQVNTTTGLTGIAVDWSAYVFNATGLNGAKIYACNPSTIIAGADNGTSTFVASTLRTAPANSAFRGLSFSPVQQTAIKGVNTPVTGNIFLNTNDTPLFQFTLVANEGNSTLRKLQLTASGTATIATSTGADITTFKLIEDVDNSGTFNAGDINLGNGSVSGATISFSNISSTYITQGSDKKFLIVASVSSSATTSRTISLSISGNSTINTVAYTSNVTNAGNSLVTMGTAANAPTGNTLTINSAVTPVISSTGTLSAVNTTYGTASATPTSFSVSGANMSAGITVTPPTGYEVSLSSGSGYANSIVVGSSGTITATTVYVRLTSTATVAGSPYLGNIVLSSTSASSINVATVSSIVSAKSLTVTGITANNKVFDGTTSATLSGTSSLLGIVNFDVVTLGGTPLATFASSSVGTGIAVSVSGYTISGAGASNYLVTQPSLSADITNAPTPVITSALTASATYGTAVVTYTITATNSPTSYNATGLPAGLTINTSNGQITGTPTGFPAVSNVTISATNNGGTTNATLAYTINPKGLTVSGAIADNKVYDKTNTAIISGSTLVGVVGSDIVSINNSGMFASALTANGITVTSIQTLLGADANRYFVTLPTGLSANITPKALTIAGAVAANKQFDGTAAANISGTLTGIISGDVVNLSGTGTFASSAIGNGIAVTSTSTISGADATNYSLTQPTGLTANITSGPTTLLAGDVAVFAVNSANPDTFSVVLLKDIGQNTIINFTDNGFTGTDTSGRTGEGFLTFTAPSALPYGTVLTWTNGMTIAGTGWSSNAPTNFAFNGSGDQLFTFQGATSNWASQSGITLIHGVNYGVALSATSGAGNTLQPNASILPTTAFINLPTSTSANGYFSNTGSSSTSVTVCGSPAQVLAALVTPAKWFGTSASVASFPSLTILNVCPTPTISTTLSLVAVNTVYGIASSTTTFNVSGADMSAAITVAAPAGYMVSLSSGSGYANSITVGAAGTIASTPVYVRIASTTAVGNYSGDVVLSSAGAANVNVATVSSTVSPKSLTITGLTANSKLFDGNTSATLSGTAVLNGVVNSDVVTLGGTPIATFATATAGTNIAVSVTGYTISGSGATNYTLTQPSLTADITTVPSPVITSALTANATYGVIATTYTITASDTPTSFNATGLPSGLTVNTSTGDITGSPTAVPGTYNVTISATNAGGTGNAILVYTILAKPLTVTGAVANNKVYTKTNAATISGSTLVGLVGTDVVTISTNGIFASVQVGTAIVVTSTQTLSGADASKYSLTLPTGLSANITSKTLTITGAVAQNKQFDGTTAATITGTLSGIITTPSVDVVTLVGTGTFASTAVANGVAVTSTSTLSGADAANYSLTQPTGLTANITQPVLYLNQFTGASACPTNGNIPTMATNATGTPLTRSTIACNPTANVFNSLTLNNTAAVVNTSYIEFSATAAVGKILNVQSLSFFRQASNSAPNQLEVRYSTDGFATSTSWGSAPNTPTTGSVITWDFTDFLTPSAGTVTFRVYPYGTQSANLAGASAATGTFRLDDVTIYGLVSLPIPPTSSVLSGTTSICDGDSAAISVAITGGTAPYTVVYNDGTSNTTVTGYTSNSNIIVSPTANTTYTLVSVTDSDSLVGTGNIGSAVITILPNFTYYADTDNDGYGDINNSFTTCTTIPGYVLDNTDCDDTNALIHSTFPFYVDADNDSYGTGSLVSVCAVNATTPPTGYSLNNTDCNDANATIYRSALLYTDADGDGYNVGSATTCYGATLPTGTSLTTLGSDCNDANAAIYRSALLYTDADADGYNISSAITCYGATLPSGTSLTTLGSDCDDTNAAVHATFSFYVDADTDTYGTGTSVSVCAVNATTPPTGYSGNNTDCNDNNATVYRSALLYTDADGDGYNVGSAITCYGATLPAGTSLTTLGSDCDDTNAAVHATFSFYVDTDIDTYGTGTSVSVCAVNATTPPTGYSVNNTDCNDTNALIYRSALLYTDADADGYNVGSAVTCYGATVPTGTSLTTLGSDCDDTNAAVHATFPFYVDTDTDTYGTGSSVSVCAVNATTPPTGYSVNNSDCDDNNATIYRSALLYTDVDNDGYNAGSAVTCYGAILPVGTSLSTLGSDCNDNNASVHATFSFYTDADGDGFGSVSATAQLLCAANATTAPVAGVSPYNTDCDDTKSSIRPNAVDVCYDGIDNDCNGNVDNVGLPGGCIPKVANLQTASCGSTVSALNTVVSASNVPGAQAFRFKITNMTTLAVQTLDSPSISFQFMNLPGVTFGTQYKIEVAIKFAGVWQGFYGAPCFVNTPSPVSVVSSTQCGSTLTSMSQYINSSYVANVTGYRYEVTNQTNGQTQYVYSSMNKFTLTQLLASNQTFATNYFVRVACRNTDGTYLPEGPGCIVKSPGFPTTQVIATLCNNYLVPSIATNITVDAVAGATLYKFRLFNGTYDFVVESVYNKFSLSMFPGLELGTLYSVQAAVQVGGIFDTNALGEQKWGKTCTLTTPNAARQIETVASTPRLEVVVNNEFNALAYPNPFAENFKLDVTTNSEENLTVRVYDMLGKLVEDRQVNASDVETLEVGANYPSGVYNVIVAQGENTKTLRVIKR